MNRAAWIGLLLLGLLALVAAGVFFFAGGMQDSPRNAETRMKQASDARPAPGTEDATTPKNETAPVTIDDRDLGKGADKETLEPPE